MKICVVTGSRSEYERLHYLLNTIDSDPEFHLDLIVANMHFSPEYGLTIRDIEADGFPISEQVEMLLSSTSEVGVSKTVGVGILGLADALARLDPDLVMVLGDRSELLAVACACVCQRIPLAHLCGGEITEGAIDDQVRHMLTKAAHLHFVANETFANRVLQMGEEDWRVCVSGSPALDDLKALPYLSIENLGNDLNLDLSQKTALVTYHPVTLEQLDTNIQINNVLGAIEEHDLQLVITYPNADAGSAIIIQAIQDFAETHADRTRLVKNLGRIRYLSLMKHASMVIGNSSSGIVEAPSFNIPAVNIGDRQAGRVFASNVIQASYAKESISESISAALEYSVPSAPNPYGDMQASARITKYIKDVFIKYQRQDILRKKFADRDVG